MLFVLLLFAFATAVCTNELAFDSQVEDEINGLLKRLDSRAVSILEIDFLDDWVM